MSRPGSVSAVHERWQMDWKVGLPFAEGQWGQLATVRDVVGAAFIAVELYPVAHKTSRVSERAVRATLRRAFGEWGLPDEIQTDGETVLNPSAADPFPSPFQLWLVGLGVRHRRIRPGRATDDAEVERGHRTLMNYVVAEHLHQHLPGLQAQLPQAKQELNGQYPSRAHGCDHQPPLVAHPELLQPRRRFDPAHEADYFDLARVDAYLAGWTWERKVGLFGQVTLGGAHDAYSVGRAHAREMVDLHFEPATREFVACSRSGEELNRWPAKRLSAADILDLPDPGNDHEPGKV